MKFIIRFLIVFVIVIFIVFGVLRTFEKSFDFHSYSREIKELLRSEYGLKVDFENLRIKFTTSLKILADNVRITQDEASVYAERVELSVPVFPLIMGKTVISGLEILNPKAHLKRFRDGKWNFSILPPAALNGDGDYDLPLKRVYVIGGELRITDEFISSQPVDFLIKGSTFNFSAKGIEAPVRMMFTGTLLEKAEQTEIRFSFYWKKGKSRNIWEDLQLGGSARIGPVSAETVRLYLGDVIPDWYGAKRISTTLHFAGGFSSRINFSGDLFIDPGKENLSPMARPRMLEIMGTYEKNSLFFKRVVLRMPEITLNGMAEIKNIWSGDPHLKVKLDTPFLNVTRLSSLIPPFLRSEPMVQFLNESIGEGEFKLEDLQFEGRYSDFLRMDQPEKMGILSGKMEIRNFSVNMENFRYLITDINGNVKIKENELVFNNVNAIYGNTILRNISGEVDKYRTNPVLTAKIEADLDMQDFHEELIAHIGSKELLEIFKPVKDLHGNLGFDFFIAVDIRAAELIDFFGELYFGEIGFSHTLFDLPIRKLRGKAYVNQTDISVENISWVTGSTVFKTKGNILNYQKDDYLFDFTFDAAGDVSELAHTVFYSFAPFKDLKGRINSRLSVKGNLDNIDFTQWADLTGSEYSFREVVFKPKGVFSHEIIKGSLKKRNILKIDFFDITLGNSAFLLSGEISQFPDVEEYDLSVKIKHLHLGDFPDFLLSYKEGDSEGEIKGDFKISSRNGSRHTSFTIDADIKKLRLDPLEELGPFMKVLQPKGWISGKFVLTGETGKPPFLKGAVEVKGLGFQTNLRKPFSGLEGKAEFTGDRIKAFDIPAKIGQSYGKVSIDIELKKVPVMNFIVDGEVVYLEDILNITGVKEKEGEKAGKAPSEKKRFFSANWNVSINSKKGTLKNLKYSNLETFFTYFKRKYDFPLFRFRAYNADWETAGKLDISRGRGEKFNNTFKIVGLNLDDFLKDVIPGMDKISGTIDVEGDINGRGFSWNRISNTLSGEVELNVKEGLIHKFDGLSQVFTYLNIIPLFKERKKEQKGEGLPFDTISGKITFKDGVGHTEDMRLEGNVIRISAVGDIDLGEKKLDLLMGVKPFTSLDALISRIPVAGRILTGEEKSLIVAYYKVDGTFDKPRAKTRPGESVARGIIGIIQRILEIPAKALSTVPTDEKK